MWQVAAGNNGRYYHDVFLEYGVALIGRGDPGEWNEEQPDEDFGGPYVLWFAHDMQDGDVLVLRQGRNRILAIGKVVGDYQYLEQFDDVNGWDLQHGRRVCWHVLDPVHEFDQDVFGANPRRLSRVRQPDVVNFVNGIVGGNEWQNHLCNLPELPVREEVLIDLPEVWQNLQEWVNQTQNFLEDYYANNLGPKELAENESTAHFVVPLLRALGWPIQNIAMEWHRIDVSVFENIPRTPENCRLLFEVKRLGQGVTGYALDQAIAKAKEQNIMGDNQYIVVTDGILYFLYLANLANNENLIPAAYANLSRLKETHLGLFQFMERPQ